MAACRRELIALVALPLAAALQPTPSGWLELRVPRVSACGTKTPDAFRLMRQLSDALVSRGRSADVTGVLLTMETGNDFSTGGDIRELAESASLYGPATSRSYLQCQRELQGQ